MANLTFQAFQALELFKKFKFLLINELLLQNVLKHVLFCVIGNFMVFLQRAKIDNKINKQPLQGEMSCRYTQSLYIVPKQK